MDAADVAALNSFLSEVQDRDARERALVLGGTGSMLAPAPAVLAAQAGSAGAARGGGGGSVAAAPTGGPLPLTPLTPGLAQVTALATLSAERAEPAAAALDITPPDAAERAGDGAGVARSRPRGGQRAAGWGGSRIKPRLERRTG